MALITSGTSAPSVPGPAGSRRNVYADCTFEVLSMRYLRDVPKLTQGTPYYIVDWRRGQEKGQTDWQPLAKVGLSNDWVARWNYSGKLARIHLAVRNPDRPQYKRMSFVVRKGSIKVVKGVDGGSGDNIGTITWDLDFDPELDGRPEQLTYQITPPGEQTPLVEVQMTRTITRLSVQDEALVREQKALTRGGGTRASSVVPYAASQASPCAVDYPIPPQLPPDVAGMQATDEERLQLMIQRTHTQIYAQAKALRDKRTEVAYLRERYSALSADYNELRHELSLTEKQYAAKEQALERERVLTSEMQEMRSQLATWRMEDAEEEDRLQRTIEREERLKRQKEQDECVVM